MTKPATVLIEKVSDAVGGLFKPHQIVRVAKAEAEARRIQAESEIEVSDVHRRAMLRFFNEEAKKQANMEAITEQALPLLRDGSEPEGMEDDWITNFFDKSRAVSDKEMQALWSGVLAGEANKPGAFARRTVNLLADLDKEDALLFQKLCGFGWMMGEVVPLVFDVHATIYSEHGINFEALTHLGSLGLVDFGGVTGFSRMGFPKSIRPHYYGKPVTLTFAKDSDNKLNLGHVMLTRAGKQLARLGASKPIDGFLEYVREKWAKEGLIPKPEADTELSGNN